MNLQEALALMAPPERPPEPSWDDSLMLLVEAGAEVVHEDDRAWVMVECGCGWSLPKRGWLMCLDHAREQGFDPDKLDRAWPLQTTSL